MHERVRSVGGGTIARRTLVGAAAAAAWGASARAQGGGSDWPTRPVRYIEPYAPGGGTDIASRLWCAAMAEVSGQTFVVENRTGAGGTIGVASVARAAPDGHTVGLGGIGTHVIAPHVLANVPYEAARDFTFIGGQWKQPVMLVANNDFPVRNVAELIDIAQREPGRHQYATGGTGNTPHLAGELFKTRAGLDLQHVPYRGPEVMVDIIAGRVPIAWVLFATGIASVREGKLRALAVSSPERNPAAREVPALAETVPGFDLVSWTCVVGPAAIPPATAARMSELSARALRQRTLVQRYEADGSTPWPATPEEVAAYRAAQEALLLPVIRTSGARAQ